MATLAALNRKARKLAGVTSCESRKAVQRKAAQAVTDALTQDARCKALRAHLDASSPASHWSDWSARRLFILTETQRAVLAEDVDASGIPAHEDEWADCAVRANRAHARYLLGVAYGADAARRAAMLDWQEPDEVSDDPERAKYLAARRAALKAAVDATAAHLRNAEPKCPEVLKGAAAMLMLLTDVALLVALPRTLQVGLMLPDALRAANMLLPHEAQVNAEMVEKLATARR